MRPPCPAVGFALTLLTLACGGTKPPSLKPCPQVTGAGTPHSGTISTGQTWTQAASPHVITGPLSISGAIVTLEECAVVTVAEGANITVGSASGPAAALVANGSTAQDGANQVLHAVVF